MTDEKTATLYEALHKFGPKHGYSLQALWVEKYDIKAEARKKDPKIKPVLHYRPTDEASKEKIINLCLNPVFNTQMFAAYTLPNVQAYEKWLNGRKATVGEIVVMNNIGQKGLQLLAQQAWEDKKHESKPVNKQMLTVDFFAKHRKLFGDVSANKTMLHHPDGRPKTVRETYNGIMNHSPGGWGDLHIAQN